MPHATKRRRLTGVRQSGRRSIGPAHYDVLRFRCCFALAAVLRRQWEGRYFAGAVRAWEKLRGEDAPVEVHELAVLVLWQGRDLPSEAIASLLRHRAAEVGGAQAAEQ